MNNFYTYIITDSNRRFLQPGISQNLNLVYNELQNYQESKLFSYAILNRIVHIETFPTKAAAQKRLTDLNQMGRMVKERLIRKNNPNWLSLCPHVAKNRTTKKAVVYA